MRQNSRPNIQMTCWGSWRCVGEGVIGYGATIRDSYVIWLDQLNRERPRAAAPLLSRLFRLGGA